MTSTKVRLKTVDAVRGLAIIGVVIFHIGWDLDFTGLLPGELSRQPEWLWFGRSLAGTFMVLVGLSLGFAHRGKIQWHPYLKRLLVIAVAAMVISAVTRLLFPTTFIYFGILHAITIATLVATPFLWMPTSAPIVAGVAFVALPLLVTSDNFDSRWLAWTGFGENPPASNDFVPMFPWVGLTLFGLGAARMALRFGIDKWLAAREPTHRTMAGLAWTGRHSLVIYLIHQPILLSLIVPLAWLLGN